ncbi:ninein-like protein isoform X4 [Hypanus sabinus]|uniref:ninein-like protein isoform X4 n=1 Tax=Hypanus sabinus TaxID=79690 RepID=UPI0028C4FD92|nr:ninein-like protein isoform X4 [Hypanus sabinus]
MDEVEQEKYVSQLKDVFDSCDATGTGYLDQEELTELCQKLHLEAQIPLLLQILRGSKLDAKVNFEEFKEGFVAVLSTGIDHSTSEDESSCLEPAVVEEVQPKYVRGSKRYGRRSLPELLDSEIETTDDLEEPLHFKAEPLVQNTKRSQLRRSASLESVESLKSDEELESHQEPQHETFEALGQLSRCDPNGFDSPQRSSTPCPETTEDHVQAVWEDLGVGKNGYLHREELVIVCKNIGLKDLKDQDIDSLFRKLDKDGDDKVSRSEFLHGLFRHGPPVSTPRSRRYHRAHSQGPDGNRHRAATPSLISTTMCSQLFSALDDGTGYASPEQIINMWQENGIKNSHEILQTLDFTVEEKVNLAELTNALENELMSSRNRTHLAALTCYRSEIDHLQGQIQQMYKERDKLRMDFDRAEKRNEQLAKEVDDRYATFELLNETKLKHLDQGYKERMAAAKVQMDKARELIVQQMNMQKAGLEQELDSLRSDEISSREKLSLAMKESARLQKELTETVEKLAESEKLVSRLQKDLDYMLREKFGALDHPNLELSGQEQRFTEIIVAYEQQCRELRDHNDELRSEVEALCSQLHVRKRRYSGSDNKDLPEDQCANLSIEAEIAIEQQKRQHLQEVQDLEMQWEAKVNYYEQEIEVMKRNFEKERKHTEESFKAEISELEEKRMRRSQETERLRGLVEELHNQREGAEARHTQAVAELRREQKAAEAALRAELRERQEEIAELRKDGETSGAKLALQRQELEEAFERERADQRQAFASERLETEQRLLKEKLRLELQHQEELQQLRYESEMLAEENSSLKRKVAAFHQDFRDLEGKVNEHRKQVAWLKDERECRQREVEELQKQIKQQVTEIAELSNTNLHLSNQNSQLSVRVDAGQSTIQLLNARIAELGEQKDEVAKVSRQLQEACNTVEREYVQQRSVWETERSLMQKQLQMSQEKIKNLELSLDRTHSEADHLNLELEGKQRDNVSLAQEVASVTESLQQAKDKVSQMHVLETELESAVKEHQTLQNKQLKLEASLMESQEQLLEANTKLMQTQSQHLQEVRALKEQVNSLVQLQMKVADGEQREQRLQQQLDIQRQEAHNLMREQQEEYERLLKQMEGRIEEVEKKLKNIRMTLQEKMKQLKEQFAKNTKSDLLLKDLYVENAQLMKALQITEQRQKSAERKTQLLDEKIGALNSLLRKIALASLS